MLNAREIVQRYCSGQTGIPNDQQIASAPALPDGWSKGDTNRIGSPVVIGNRTVGFVGAIERDSASDPFPWVDETSHPDFGDAQESAIKQAMLLKGTLRAAQPDG